MLVNRDPLESFTAFGGFLFARLSASLLVVSIFFRRLATANLNEINGLSFVELRQLHGIFFHSS